MPTMPISVDAGIILGGTFAVFLACDALRKGYSATIYTYNITVFDPTWFAGEVDLAERLARQREIKANDARLVHATNGYLEFLRLGGGLRFVDLTVELIHGMLRRRLPIITGLSSTYLYRSAREHAAQNLADDLYTRLLRIAGVPRSGQTANSPTDQELQVRRWFAQLAVHAKLIALPALAGSFLFARTGSLVAATSRDGRISPLVGWLGIAKGPRLFELIP